MSMLGQKGFTLLEILVALAIGGLIVPATTAAIWQIATGTARVNTSLIVQQDLDIASSWFTRDLSQTRTTDVVDKLLVPETTPVDSMIVGWVDETADGSAHCVRYYVEDGLLKRNYDGGGGTDCMVDGTVGIVGRYVAEIWFSRSGDFITVAITTSQGGDTKALSYFVTPRSDNEIELQ